MTVRCLCAVLAVCMPVMVAAGSSYQTNREEIETVNEPNLSSVDKHRSERSFTGVVDAVGLVSDAIGVIQDPNVVNAVSVALDAIVFIQSLRGGDDSHIEEIHEKLTGIQNSLEVIESNLGDMISDITHSQSLYAITPSYMRLKNYISDYVNYIATDVSISQQWLHNILGYGDEGIKQTLNNLNRMITGDSLLFSSILVTFEEQLNRRGSSNYYSTTREFMAYMLSLQAAGYAIHINALILNGSSYEGVKVDMADQMELQEDVIRTLLLNWPAGTWGLPEAKIGCPVYTDFDWRNGNRFQRTEVIHDGWTPRAHFPRLHRRSGRGMQQYFCMKDSQLGGEGDWPAGSYCIFKKFNCPAGFICAGYAVWDDKDYKKGKMNTGILPDGTYDGDTTKIYYACRNDGRPNDEIELPTQRPFHLFRYDGFCQKVKNANYSEEYIFWDTADESNGDYFRSPIPDHDFTNRGIRLRYCYYTSTLFSHE